MLPKRIGRYTAKGVVVITGRSFAILNLCEGQTITLPIDGSQLMDREIETEHAVYRLV
jgi:hypothetical protein